jgi:rhodanese-related sulfurtransferase
MVQLLVLLILLIRSSAMKGGKKVTVQELISITNEGRAQLIDLRPSSEFNDGHITGSINIPFSDLENRSHEIKSYDDRSLVLICETGSQSANAGEAIRACSCICSLFASYEVSRW